VQLSGVDPEPITWLWPDRIAIGKLSILVGNPGLGKSTITLDIAARVSRGFGWPGYPASTATPCGVLLLSAEDDLSDTIRPRLDAAGADVLRIRALTTVKHFDSESRREVHEPFNLEKHLPMLEAGIEQVADCRLIIIDPISAFLGRTDSHNNSEVRGLLAPLSELAAKHRIAVVAVSHLNKGDGNAINRVMGSMAFTAAARAVFAVVKDKDDPMRRLFLPIKNNLARDDTGFAYRLIQTEGNDVPSVAWEPLPVTMSADEAITPEAKNRGPDPDQRREAEDWLNGFLQQGPKSAAECYSQAGKDGFTRATLLRAKAAAKIVAEKQGFENGFWTWRLPTDLGTHWNEPEPTPERASDTLPGMAKNEGTHEGTHPPLPPIT